MPGAGGSGARREEGKPSGLRCGQTWCLPGPVGMLPRGCWPGTRPRARTSADYLHHPDPPASGASVKPPSVLSREFACGCRVGRCLVPSRCRWSCPLTNAGCCGAGCASRPPLRHWCCGHGSCWRVRRVCRTRMWRMTWESRGDGAHVTVPVRRGPAGGPGGPAAFGGSAQDHGRAGRGPGRQDTRPGAADGWLALVDAVDGPGGGDVAVGGLADLAGVRPQAAHRGDLEAVDRPAVRDQGP